MKTAYELAMERLEAASGPTRKLNDEEKSALAEIDSKYDAQIASLRFDFEAQIASATTRESYLALKEEMAREINAAEERRTHAKDAIWGAD
jgi:hypothetical protein